MLLRNPLPYIDIRSDIKGITIEIPLVEHKSIYYPKHISFIIKTSIDKLHVSTINFNESKVVTGGGTTVHIKVIVSVALCIRIS